MAINFTRLTNSVKDLPTQLNRVTGQANDLLGSVPAQVESSLNNLKSQASSSIISVTDQFNVGEQLESAVAGFRNSIPTDIQQLADIEQAISQGAAGLIASASGSVLQTATVALGQTENKLKEYATYNYIITLACLTINEINFPDSTYRVGPPKVTVLKSGGGLGASKAKTAYETSDLSLEYFIDDLEIEGIIAPTTKSRSTNATVLNFTVTEPYSMGLFLQTLMIAANKAGHKDYLKAPYALIIEFRGYDDNGNPLNLDRTTRRVFPISINTVDFDVTAGGSRYAVQTNAWQEIAYSSVAQSTRSDTILQGASVQELLHTGTNSLTAILNKAIREKDDEGNSINRDEYVIMFPNQLSSSLGISNQAGTNLSDRALMTEEEFYSAWTGADTELFDFDPDLLLQNRSEAYERYIEISASNNNISAAVRRAADNTETANPIGKGQIDSAMITGGAVPFGEEAYTYDQRTGIYRSDQVTISRDFRTFQFKQGTRIEDIIEEIVLISEYAQTAATQLQSVPAGGGMIPWFRIHAQTFLVPDEEIRRRTGQNPKIYVYAVVPYQVHSSTFQQASQPSVGIEQRKAAAAKRYDFIYTGQNDDIIDFEINFNNAFYTAMSSNMNGAGTTRLATRDSVTVDTAPRFQPAAGNEGVGSVNSDRSVTEVANATATGNSGGSDADTPAIRVARMFHEAIVNNDTDMVTMELTIIGDPYYLADSGQGNYFSPPSGFTGYTSDGTMDYQSSEVEVLVTFKTPIDYNTGNGLMIFPEIDNVPVNAFTGLYKVNIVRNSFAGGKFTQVLELIRRNNQDSDTNVRGGGTGDNSTAVAPSDTTGSGSGDTQTPQPVIFGGQDITNTGTAQGTGAGAPPTPTQPTAQVNTTSPTVEFGGQTIVNENFTPPANNNPPPDANIDGGVS